MRFAKMNGLGNDYIFFDATKKNISFKKSEICILCDRHFGIGADGVIIVNQSCVADFKMTIYNSDGSEAEMCGNALRCLAKYVHKLGLTYDKHLNIETPAGIKYVSINSDDTVTANMGIPVVDLSTTKIDCGNTKLCGYKVNVGNPHFVIFCENIDDLFCLYATSISENTAVFPEKTNVEFVKDSFNRNECLIRIYERGSGETLACGTGTTAVFETAFLLGKLQDGARFMLKGGSLFCKHNSKGEVLLTGVADFNFIGETNLI